MHQTMFPLIIVNVLENHATSERPLTVTEITDIVNREFGAFAFEKQRLMNRTTVLRILDAIELWTETGNLLNFRLIQAGTEGKKLFFLQKAA
ncbi:MAG: hypothetical protein LUE86_05485 [Clostridiales bacterium]|nr:hypothetical protein [Clostridiales bacterium]